MEISETNIPPIQENESKKDYRNIIIACLSVALLATLGYLIAIKTSTKKTIQEQRIELTEVNNEKSELQSSFDESLARLDSLGSVTDNLKVELNEKKSEITNAKAEIRKILNKKNITEAELAKAKKLISSLNEKINGMQEQIAQLTDDNRKLEHDNAVLTIDKEKLNIELSSTNNEKQELKKQVDVASTLHASNINISAFNVKRNGKEVISNNPNRVDKMVVSFDLSNRIIKSGSTDLYIVILGPDNKPIATKNNLPGTFNTREEGNKTFTAKVPVELEPSKTKNISFSFAPEGNFIEGEYKIEIYQNGFLIGQGKKTLKKSGIFS
jgi:myosin heavy subunit